MDNPTLYLSADCYLKIKSATLAVETECGFFGVPENADGGDMTLVDIAIPPQIATQGSVRLKDSAELWTVELQNRLESAGYPTPDIAERYWIHTHPGTSADPSGGDIEDFAKRQRLGFPYLVHVIFARKNFAVWARLDIQLHESWIEIPLDVQILARPHCQETIKTTLAMVRQEKLGGVRVIDNRRVYPLSPEKSKSPQSPPGETQSLILPDDDDWRKDYENQWAEWYSSDEGKQHARYDELWDRWKNGGELSRDEMDEMDRLEETLYS